jgi:hypothetical protein
MYQAAIYIFPVSVCLFCCSQIGRPILGIYKLHRYMNVGIGNEARIFVLGIQKSNFRYSVGYLRREKRIGDVKKIGGWGEGGFGMFREWGSLTPLQ